jgi:hypothetical protein
MNSTDNQLQTQSSAPAPPANSSSIGFVSTLAQQIVTQPGSYSDEFISGVNQKTGVYWRTITSICASLHDPKHIQIIEEILTTLTKAILAYDPKSDQNLVSKFRRLLLRVTKPSMKIVWEDMDLHLMANMNCGKKPFSVYSIPWQIKLKNIVIYAVAYNLDLYLTSLKN